MRKNKFIINNFFEKVALSILATYSFLLFTSFSACSQQNLEYYLEINEKTWDSFSVNIIVKNNRLDKLLCGFPEIYPGLYESRSTSSHTISDFKVSGTYQEELLLIQVNSTSWLIDTKDNDIVNISYRVIGTKDQFLGERMSRTYSRVDCGIVFLYVREFKNSPIHLVVQVPNRWKLATGLAPANQFFEYYADNYEQLARNSLYMAPFNDIYFSLRGRTCFIVIDGKQNSDINELSAIPARVAFYQTKLFNDVPFDRYMFIFKIFFGHRQVVSKAYQNLSICYLSYEAAKENLSAIAKQISSNFFQVWNGNRFFPHAMRWEESNRGHSTSSLWFYYGMNEYYGGLSLVRIGYWDEKDFIDDNINSINRFLRHHNRQDLSLATLSSRLLKFDEDKSIEFIRLKGQLVSLLLDLKIREATNNKRSLDDVMFFMNKWFGSENGAYNDGDILRACCAVTGVDLTSFFDQYIDGAADLPFVETLQSAGIFLESKLDILADLGDIRVTDDGNIVTHLSKLGPLEIAGLKPGDKLVALNDQKIYYPQMIEQIVDSLTVGQDVDISIKRDQLLLMLVAKTAGKPCQVVSLLSGEPKTEQQQTIRKAWLSKQLE